MLWLCASAHPPSSPSLPSRRPSLPAGSLPLPCLPLQPASALRCPQSSPRSTPAPSGRLAAAAEATPSAPCWMCFCPATAQLTRCGLEGMPAGLPPRVEQQGFGSDERTHTAATTTTAAAAPLLPMLPLLPLLPPPTCRSCSCSCTAMYWRRHPASAGTTLLAWVRCRSWLDASSSAAHTPLAGPALRCG